jgi:hypothetical protein
MTLPTQVKGTFGSVLICDCMDPDVGLPSLKDQSIDLIMTDPPWGFLLKNQQNPMGLNKKAKKTHVKVFNDEFNPGFTTKWMTEVLRVGKSVMVVPGRKFQNWYIANFPPLDLFGVTFDNGQTNTTISNFTSFIIFLCYGERFKQHKFHKNYLHTYIRNGFLHNIPGLVHPYPKPAEDWKMLIEPLHPETVLDPFMGSGCLAQVGEWCGIKWLGYELNPDYYHDIEIRINVGKRQHQMYSRKKIQQKLPGGEKSWK